MENVKRILTAMGLEVVSEKAPDSMGYDNRGFIVVKVGDEFFKTTYTEDSYGDDYYIESIRKVTPKPVQKVEYV